MGWRNLPAYSCLSDPQTTQFWLSIWRSARNDPQSLQIDHWYSSSPFPNGIFSPVGVASSARPADQFQPGLPGTNLRGFRVVGVVADKEVDAAVPGDEDEIVAEQIVPQGYGRNGQQQPRAY